MFISGSIGITILKNNEKILILLADDHSNDTYCINNLKDHLDITNFLKKELKEGNQILLEEVPRDGFNLEELWPNSPHTQSLKDFFLNEDKIVGIDIRPYLIPFSWDILDIDNNLMNFSIDKYIEQLNDFFHLKGDFYNKIFNPTIKKIIIKNEGLGKHLLYLKNKFIDIKKEIGNENKNINYYFENNKDILEDISNLCDEIMDFNTLLNIFTSNKKTIIHAGLYHSNNMLKWLINSYNFKVIYKNGINQLSPGIASKNYSSCIYLPGINIFGFKD